MTASLARSPIPFHPERARSADRAWDAPAGDAPVTLQRAVKMPWLRSGGPRIVAGADRLDRAVHEVLSHDTGGSIFEGPGGVLFATSASIGTAPTDHRRLVRHLAERDACGLIVELAAGTVGLPVGLLRAADDCGLVVIELHRPVDSEAAAGELRAMVASRQLAVLRRADDVVCTLTNLLLDGASTPEILFALAEAVDNPVIVTKAGSGVAYHSAHRSSSEEILTRYEHIEPGLGTHHETESVIARIIPGARGQTWGSLVLLSHETPIDDFDAVLLERIALLIGVGLRQAHEEATLTRRERGNFLADVASGRLAPHEAIDRARALGFNPGRRALLPLSVVPTRKAGADHLERDTAAGWVSLWRSVRQHFESSRIPVIIGSHGSGGETTVLLGIEQPGDRGKTIESFVNRLETLIHRTALESARPVVVAGAVGDWEDLAGELRRVNELGPLIGHAPVSGWHDAAKPDFAFVLWRLRDDAAVIEYSDRLLRPIIEHDRDHTHKLLATLEALSAAGWQMSKTAQALYLNRRSLYPRIARLEELLGASLNDLETRLGIDVALRVRSARMNYRETRSVR